MFAITVRVLIPIKARIPEARGLKAPPPLGKRTAGIRRYNKIVKWRHWPCWRYYPVALVREPAMREILHTWSIKYPVKCAERIRKSLIWRTPIPLRKDDEFEFMPQSRTDQSEHRDFARRVNKLDGPLASFLEPRGDISRLVVHSRNTCVEGRKEYHATSDNNCTERNRIRILLSSLHHYFSRSAWS